MHFQARNLKLSLLVIIPHRNGISLSANFFWFLRVFLNPLVGTDWVYTSRLYSLIVSSALNLIFALFSSSKIRATFGVQLTFFFGWIESFCKIKKWVCISWEIVLLKNKDEDLFMLLTTGLATFSVVFFVILRTRCTELFLNDKKFYSNVNKSKCKYERVF